MTSAGRLWRTLVVLSLCTFVVGTSELVVVGILPLIADELEVSIAIAGQLVTGYALAFGGLTPLVASVIGRLPTRPVLLACLVVFAAGNMLATSAPNYVLLLLSRLVIAAAAGVFEVVATAAAARLVQPHERGRAIALIVAGFSIALIVGVPLGTIIGSAFTWRAPFVVLAGLAVGAGLGLLVFMPSTAAPPDTPESAPAGLVRSPAVVYVLVTTGLVFSGQYIAWTYLASFLAEVTRVQADAIALTLLLFGLGSAGGNFVGGHAADRFGLRLTLLGAVASLIVSLVGLSLVGSTLLGALAVVVVWAMAIGAFVPAQQYLLVRVAPEATSLGLALNLAALNGGIALGAALGGLVVYTGGLPGVGVCGALATALAVPTLVRSTSKA